ncbi:hypothetical protein [Antribacter gilvus]|uniref:hypothetical protein n=1 Tax=Antribacter gilvus TaxID=2304675 RepID=UPI000F7AA0F2|nr:hypothetical protein [Antribacter gilvus]
MDDRWRRAAHLVRAVVLASTTFCLGVGAHLWAGGREPSAPGLVLLGALTLVVCCVAARFRARAVWLTAFLGAMQTLLHHGLALVADPAPGPSSGAPAGLDRVLDHGVAHGQPMGGPAGLGADAGMYAAHLLAVVATALLLAALERSADLLRAVLTSLRLLLGAFRPVAIAAAPRPAWPTGSPQSVVTLLMASVAPRRGPPGSFPAAA